MLGQLQRLWSRDKWLILLAGLASSPLVLWAVCWVAQGWFPQGDEAIIALKTHDVFSAHPPLLGMRSTSAFSAPGVWAHHPGPLEFYVLSVPYALTGWRPIGLIVGSLTVAVVFVIVALWNSWAVGRGRGVAVVLIAILGVQVVIGPSLVLPWNPWPPVLGLLAVTVLAWRLLVGNFRVLPGFAAATSFVLQTNLTFLPLLFPMLGILGWVGWVRWYRRRGAVWPLPGSQHVGQLVWWRRRGYVTVAVLVICWLPSLVELWTIHPNNVSQIWGLIIGIMSPVKLVGVVAVAAVMVWLSRSVLRWQQVPRGWALQRTTAVMMLGLLLAVVGGGQQRLLYLSMAIAIPFFALGVVCSRWLVFRGGRHKLFGVVWLLAFAAAALVAPGSLGSALARPVESHNVDDARTPTNQALAVLHARGIGSGPIVVKASGIRSYASIETALVMQLTNNGYQPHYDSFWPRAEDDQFRRISHAPTGAPVLTLHDGQPATISNH